MARTPDPQLPSLIDAVKGKDLAAFFAWTKSRIAELAALYLDVGTIDGTAYTLRLADAATRYLRTTSASAVAVTVPPDSFVQFPIGARIRLRQHGAGLLTVVAGSGVTLNCFADAESVGEGAELWVTKVATNTWDVGGDVVDKYSGTPAPATIDTPMLFCWYNRSTSTTGAGIGITYFEPWYLASSGGLSAAVNTAVMMTRAGTLRRLSVKHQTAGSSANRLQYNLEVNGVLSTVEVTAAGNSTTRVADNTHTVSVAEGDLVAVRIYRPDGAVSTAPSNIVLSFEFVAT